MGRSGLSERGRSLARTVRAALHERNPSQGPPSGEPTRMDLSHSLSSGVTIRVRSDSDWWVFNEVFVEGDYDPAIDLALTRCQQNPYILDLGANVGFFAARVADRAARREICPGLTLVEGSPTVYRELASRLDDLRAAGASVEAVNGLIGDRTGTGVISEVEFGARNSVHAGHNASIVPVGQMAHQEVPFVDLDRLVGPDRQVDLLKCDIEGSEQSFIEQYRDDLLRRTGTAVFEFHHRLCDVPRCLDLLRACGLDVVSSRDQQDATSLVVLERS